MASQFAMALLSCCRRKKVMEAVFKDEGGWRDRFVHMAERIKDRERHVKMK